MIFGRRPPPAVPSTGTFSRWTLESSSASKPPTCSPLLSPPLTPGFVQQERGFWLLWHLSTKNICFLAHTETKPVFPQEACLVTSFLSSEEKALDLTTHRPTSRASHAGRDEISDQYPHKGVRPPSCEGGSQCSIIPPKQQIYHMDTLLSQPQNLSPFKSCSSFLPKSKNIPTTPTQPETRPQLLQYCLLLHLDLCLKHRMPCRPLPFPPGTSCPRATTSILIFPPIMFSRLKQPQHNYQKSTCEDPHTKNQGKFRKLSNLSSYLTAHSQKATETQLNF